MKEYDVRYHTLPNSVRNLNIHVPESDLASCTVFVKSGPANETKEEHGINHKIEHNLYKGTEKRSEEEWSKAADRLGGVHVAFTEKEYTALGFQSLAKDLGKNMALLTEVLLKPKFPRGQIVLEDGVIVNEIKDYQDDNGSRIEELFESLLYDKRTGMSRSTLGTKKSISVQKRKNLREYMDRWYRGDNVLVVLAGRVRRKGTLVEKYFGNLPDGHIKKDEVKVEFGKDTKKIVTESSNQVHFMMGVPGLPMNDEKFFVQQVMEVILGGHAVFEEYTLQSSKLFDLIRIKNGSSYDISAVSYSGRKVGYFGIWGTVQPSKFYDTFNLVKDEFFGLPSKTTKEDVSRAKNFLRYYYTLVTEKPPSEVGQLMGFPALMFDFAHQPREILKKIEEVKLSDIRELSKDILKPEKLRVAALGPVNEELKWVRGLI